MVNLTKDAPLNWRSYPNTLDGNYVIEAGSNEVFAGAMLAAGAVDGTVTEFAADAVGGFKGVALEGGVAGETISVRQIGLAEVIGPTVAAGDEGTQIHVLNTTTPSSNAVDMTKGSTTNANCGQIAEIVDDAANKALFLLVADGFRTVVAG